jgi:hypothetical protein
MEFNTLKFPCPGKGEMRNFRFLIFVTVLALAPLCSARDVAVITDKSNGTSAVASADLLKLLKTDMQHWPDGRKVTIFLNDPGSADVRLMFQKVYNMSPDEARKFVDAHKGNIMVMNGDEMVVKAVAQLPGSIGLVNVYSLNSSVKVLRVDGKLPLEQGYLLHGN